MSFQRYKVGLFFRRAAKSTLSEMGTQSLKKALSARAGLLIFVELNPLKH